MSLTLEELRAKLDEARSALPAWLLARSAELASDAEARAKLNATTKPRARSGRLRQSIRGSVRERSGVLEILLSAGGGRPGAADVHYARVQEEGGTPRRGKYFAMPVGPARTRAGVARFASPRDVPGLFVIDKGKRPILAKRTADGGIEPWYILIDRIRPTWYAKRAAEATAAAAPKVLEPMLAEVLSG